MTRQGPPNPVGLGSTSRSRGGQQLATPVPAGLIGRYQILDKIGEGGMGSLFLARDPAIDRLVAIKLLRHGLDTEALRERFSREARAAGRLRHLHIVTIFDVGEHEGVPFIAMEFLAGETLAELIREGARLSLSRRLKLLEELCDGLSYAHRTGLVHRDIKPANLMVDADGVLKILDFGIVRVTDSGMTQSGVLVGTVNYMSPEQVVGGAVDHRSDIFAVGLVAYELISGKQTFPGTMKDGLLNKIINVAAEPLAAVVPGIDAEVAAIVEQALQKEPADRYQDLVRMRNDLSRTRVRIEQEEELAASSAAADAGETAIIGEHETAAFETPRPSTPAMAHEAEHALASGDFRAALTLAGRSAAINPQDRVASSVAARAEAALLDRGRLLESASQLPAPAPSGPGAPVPLPSSTVHGGGGNVIWLAVVIAVLALGVAMASFWLRNASTATSQVSTQKPSQSSSGAPPPSSEARVTPPAPGPAAGASEALPSPPAVDSPGAGARTEATAAPGASNPASLPEPTVEPVPRVAEPPPVSRSASARGRRGEPERQPVTAGRAEVPPAAAAAPSGTVAAPPPSPAPPAAPLRVGVDVSAPQRTHYAPPVYPPDLQAAGAEGTVGLELTIGPDGHVSDARVVRSARGFDDAAVAAARQWEFAVSRRNGEASAVIYQIEVPFKLPEPGRPTAPLPAPPSAKAPAPPAPPPPVSTAPPKPAETAHAASPAVEQGDEIRAVLQRYKAAWEALDPKALERVQALSARDSDEVRRAMSSANSYRMDIVVRSVTVDPSGKTATARVELTRRNNPKIGRPNVAQQASEMHFEKRADGWMITSIQ